MINSDQFLEKVLLTEIKITILGSIRVDKIIINSVIC